MVKIPLAKPTKTKTPSSVYAEVRTVGYCQACRKEGVPYRRPTNTNFTKGVDICLYCPRCDRKLTHRLSANYMYVNDIVPEKVPDHVPKFGRDQLYPNSVCCKVPCDAVYVITCQETMGSRYLGKFIWICSKCKGFHRMVSPLVVAHRSFSRTSVLGVELCSRVSNAELSYYARYYERPEYHRYLQSEEWKRKRIEAMKRAGYKCQLCSSRDELRVHHNTYERLGQELLSDLFVLCDTCHAKFHDKIKSPPDQREVDFQKFVKTLG